MVWARDDLGQLLELAEQLDFAAFVPDAFQEFLPLIEEGLACFVSELPMQRRVQIVADQAQLPATATVEQRLVQWMRCCPTLHKLGQLLARDRRLPTELCAELQKLEWRESKTPVEALREIIEAQLGPLVDSRIELDGVALAEASVAVVVKFDSPAGAGVFKILKPGIEQRLEEDLRAWDALAEFLEAHRARLHLDHVDYRDTMQRVRELLSNEVDLTAEQQHLAEAADLYAGHARIAIPRLLPYCSPLITAMEFLDGVHVTAGGGHVEGGQLAELVAEALLVAPIFNTLPRALFHADPHAGNLLLTRDGRLGLVDWGLAGHLSKADREQVTQILVGCLTFDAARICRAVDGLAMRVTDPVAMRRCVEAILADLAKQPVGGMSCVMQLLDSIVIGGHVVFGEDLLLFRKLMHIVEGVMGDIDPSCSLDQMLMQAGIRQYGQEVFRRMLAVPFSRDFGTHLSNLDLMELMCCGPMVMMRRLGY